LILLVNSIIAFVRVRNGRLATRDAALIYDEGEDVQFSASGRELSDG